jgi:branched-chain amino acid transport system substrate-binding protein
MSGDYPIPGEWLIERQRQEEAVGMDRTRKTPRGEHETGLVSRRYFLRIATLAGLASGGALLAACQQAAPAGPTTAPAKPAEAKPTEAAKPAAPVAPAAGPSPAAVTSPAAIASPAASPAAAAAAKPGGPTEFKIGAVFPMTGGSVAQGEAYVKGAKLAEEEINARGGVEGIKVQVIPEDHSTQPNLAVTAFKKLSDVDKVGVIITSFSSPTLAILPLAEEQRIPLVNPAANSPRLIGASKGNYLISAIANVALEAEVALSYASKMLKATKMAYVFRNDDFGNGLKDIAVEMWKKMGGEVVAQESHEPTAQEFATLAAKVKAANPDFLYLATSAAIQGQLVKQLREGGVTQQLLSYQGFEVQEILSVGGAAAEGALYTISGAPPSGPTVEAYKARFKAKYGADPVTFNSLMYDAVNDIMRVVGEVRKRGLELNGPNIRDVFFDLKTFEGVSGKYSPLKDGGCLRALDLKTVKDGKFEVFKTAAQIESEGIFKYS